MKNSYLIVLSSCGGLYVILCGGFSVLSVMCDHVVTYVMLIAYIHENHCVFLIKIILW